MEDKYKALLLLVLLLGLGAGAALTTIENNPQVPPSFTWSYFDKNDAIIADIDTATISGTVTFKARLTNVPNPAVDTVVLRVYRSSDNVLMGTWTFSQGNDPNDYTLLFDTTQLADGEYRFEFSCTLLVGGGGDLTLSVLYFSFKEGEGGTIPEPVAVSPLMLTMGGIVAVLAIYVVVKRR